MSSFNILFYPALAEIIPFTFLFTYPSRSFTDCGFSTRLEMEWFSSSWKRYQWGWKRDVVSVCRLSNPVNSDSPYLAGNCSAVQYAWVPTNFTK